MASTIDPQTPGPSKARLSSNERRKLVLLGDLPADFLRLSVPISFTNVSSEVQQLSFTAGQQVLPLDAANIAQHNLLQAQHAFYSFVPPNTRGRISITIVEAKLAKNYGFVRMDPYCRIRVGNTVFETPTDIRGGRAPKWNRIVHAYLPHGVESIYVQIYDEKAFSNDECIAWAHVVLPSGVFNGEVIDDWYQLTGQQGAGREGVLNLIIAFHPIQQVTSNEGQQAQPQITQQAVARVEVTEEDVKELHGMFQNVDADVIRCILEEKRGNKDAAVNSILEMTAGQ